MDKCVYNVLVEDLPAEEVCVPTNLDRLDLIPATIQLAGAEIELVPTISREIRLKKALDSLKDKYDYNIIDCPPSLCFFTLNAITASVSIVIHETIYV